MAGSKKWAERDADPYLCTATQFLKSQFFADHFLLVGLNAHKC